MDAGTLLLGAGIALGSAGLGIVSEAAKGWLVRRSTNADKRKAFQHRTAIELQETLQGLFADVISIYEGMQRQYRATRIWGDSDVAKETANSEAARKARVLMLMERLDDSTLRQGIQDMLRDSLAIYTTLSREEALTAQDVFVSDWNRVNVALGKVIRDSWPD